jgi:hypothetical protein
MILLNLFQQKTKSAEELKREELLQTIGRYDTKELEQIIHDHNKQLMAEYAEFLEQNPYVPAEEGPWERVKDAEAAMALGVPVHEVPFTLEKLEESERRIAYFNMGMDWDESEIMRRALRKRTRNTK